MIVRPAEAADLPTLVDLERACFGVDAWSAGQLAEELAADRSLLVLASDAHLAGYASVSVVADDAELLRIAVAPDRRRHGHGRTLLSAAVEASRQRGAARMLLEVDAENDAGIGLYAASGFVALARRRGYYRGRDAVVMERGLR